MATPATTSYDRPMIEAFARVRSAEAGDADPDQFDCSELVKWAAARSGVEITDLADVERFKAAVEARVVGDLMAPPATIQGHATVDAAFREMHRRHLSALYVVDATGRPTGYLDLLELAVNYVDALEAGTADQTT